MCAGCGGGGDPVRTERDESPELSGTPSATPSAPAATETPSASAPSAPVPPEDAPGGAGDEEPIRMRAAVVVGARGITPARVTVPAFFAVELSVRNDTAREQVVFVDGAGPERAVSVGAGETRPLRLGALRPGSYRIDGGPGGKATLVARGEP